jgi:hypothetical protein
MFRTAPGSGMRNELRRATSGAEHRAEKEASINSLQCYGLAAARVFPGSMELPPDCTSLFSNKKRSTLSKLIVLLLFSCTGSGSRASQIGLPQKCPSRITFTASGLAWMPIIHRHSLSFTPADSSQPSTRRWVAPKSISPQKSSGRLTTMGWEVLRTTTHKKGTALEGLIS